MILLSLLVDMALHAGAGAVAVAFAAVSFVENEC